MRAVPLVVVCLFAGPAIAVDGDRASETATQKKSFQEMLARAMLDKVTTAETDDLIVYTTAPEARAKVLAESAQKVYATSRKELKVEEKDKPWPGKLSVVVLTESKQFATFVRVAENRRPDKRESYSLGLRADAPFVVTAPELGAKVTDAGQAEDVAFIVAAAVLNKKAGTGSGNGTLPAWVQVGFGQAMAARADGRAEKLTAYKTKIKNAVVGKKAINVQLADVWSGKQTKDSDTVAAAFIEYMLYGMDAGKFLQFASGFKPVDTMPMPTVAGVFASLEWMPDTLELGWKQWLLKLK